VPKRSDLRLEARGPTQREPTVPRKEAGEVLFVNDSNGVEAALQPNRPHVTLDVLALGIQGSAHVEHLRRAIDERELKMRFQMEGVEYDPFGSSGDCLLEHVRVDSRLGSQTAGDFFELIL
jgi:hypothetical protein